MIYTLFGYWNCIINDEGVYRNLPAAVERDRLQKAIWRQNERRGEDRSGAWRRSGQSDQGHEGEASSPAEELQKRGGEASCRIVHSPLQDQKRIRKYSQLYLCTVGPCFSLGCIQDFQGHQETIRQVPDQFASSWRTRRALGLCDVPLARGEERYQMLRSVKD